MERVHKHWGITSIGVTLLIIYSLVPRLQGEMSRKVLADLSFSPQSGRPIATGYFYAFPPKGEDLGTRL